MDSKHWTFEQETPSSTWIVNNIPENAKGAVITHVIDGDGLTVLPKSQVMSNDGIELSFGVKGVSGTAYGNYYFDSAEKEIIAKRIVIPFKRNNGRMYSIKLDIPENAFPAFYMVKAIDGELISDLPSEVMIFNSRTKEIKLGIGDVTEGSIFIEFWEINK